MTNRYLPKSKLNVFGVLKIDKYVAICFDVGSEETVSLLHPKSTTLYFLLKLQKIFDLFGYLLEFWYLDSIHLHLVFVYMEFMWFMVKITYYDTE